MQKPAGDRSKKERGMSASNKKTTDEARIRELIEAWAEAVRAKDIDGIMAHHAPDIVFFDVPLPIQFRGVDEYKKSWDRFFAWFGDSGVFEISELSIAAGDDAAFCYGLIRCGGTETSGDKVELVVRLT